MAASTNTMTSFLDRMSEHYYGPDRETTKAAYSAALVKIIAEPDSEKGLYLRRALEKLVKATLIFMEHGRRMTVTEEDARHAAECLGFTVPEATQFCQHTKSAFHGLVKQCMQHFDTDALLNEKALDILQTVFEALEDGTYTATPTKGGRTLKLESPTGVHAAIFEMDWDETEMEEDEDEFQETDDQEEGEAEDVELEADDESSDEEDQDE